MLYKKYKIKVLFEDNHLLVVNKPAGMPSQKDKSEDYCMLDWAKDYIKDKYNKPGAVYVGLVHRIDRPVSGVMVMARTSKALERLNVLFKTRDVKKVYHALSKASLPDEEGELIDYIYKDSEKLRARIQKKEKKGNKIARLSYNLLGRFGHFYLYEIELHTGRYHQIRAQMSNIGAPLLGDFKYGYKRGTNDRSIGLHAKKLSFIHPVTKKELNFDAPYPQLIKTIVSNN